MRHTFVGLAIINKYPKIKVIMTHPLVTNNVTNIYIFVGANMGVNKSVNIPLIILCT